MCSSPSTSWRLGSDTYPQVVVTPVAMASDATTAHLRLDVAYDGTAFSGWAAQPGLRTVQGTIEAALRTVFRVPLEEIGAVRLSVAGRTDAGVHARGQVCSADLPLGEMAPGDLARRLARLLPGDVVVRRVSAAPGDFDARFSASWRRYAYQICDDPTVRDPLRRHEVLHWRRRLDDEAMNNAALGLLGEHDFAAFCKRREGAGTVRDLVELRWSRAAGLLSCRVLANAFCHNMVRALVGCLLVVGEGRRSPSWAVDVLAAGVRDPRVLVVPPHGLTLEQVGYPSRFSAIPGPHLPH